MTGTVNTSRQRRIAQLKSAMAERILVIDGAMGTAIQNQQLNAEDFGGADLEGCNEYLVITKPEVIRAIHEEHLAAGADIIETNTFGGTPLVLDEYGLGSRAHEINLAACRIAHEAAQKFSHGSTIRWVAGSIGPTTKAISVTGGVSFQGLIDTFYIQAKALFEGGADYFLIETAQDTRNVKAALLAIEKLFLEVGETIPIAVSGTIEPMGTMLAGQSVEALTASLAHTHLLYLGLNCATGPEFMTDHIRTLADISPFPVGCLPNAGLPDENGNYLETPAMMTHVLSRFVDSGWVNVIGGCCGTRPEHTKAFAQLVKGKKPHLTVNHTRSLLSGIECLEVTPEMRPLIVGERTNVIGSKKFKKLICQELFEDASEVARAQVKTGAHIIDICLANPDRNEFDDMRRFLEVVTKKVKVPLMIDSTDHQVIEMALTYCQGKAVINSINLEDGEERFELVVPMAKKFGAALVVGCIDENPEQGMGVTRQRKLEIATRCYDLLTGKYGIPAQDIYWDPLVFPCGTGDAQYLGSAEETIEGIRLIKEKFPLTKTVLGISNISFGLPAAGREVLNSVFLYHCVQAGLDLAIVNAEKLERYASIPDIEKLLSEDLLYNRSESALAAFAAHFREKKVDHKPKDKSAIPLHERLAGYIIEGSRDGLKEDLDEAMLTMKPLEIINGPLMAGMDEVGRLFNANKLIVAEVLQSAEAMKASVAHLEPNMEKSDSAARGKILLATVKGDVHDIGKNLVDIILSNNGFEVINLGIKVQSETLINAIKEHVPDIVGLSGLLVKSAQQMVLTAEDFSKAGISTPLLVGGAALSSNFVDRQISKAYVGGMVAYAKDAMSGLDLAKSIVDPDLLNKLKLQLAERRNLNASPGMAPATKKVESKSEKRSLHVPLLDQIPEPPDRDRHVWINTPAIDQIWPFINPMMLYGRHLGIKGGVVKKLSAMAHDPQLYRELKENEPKALSIWESVEEVKQQYRGTDCMRPSAVWRFVPTYSEGNRIHCQAEDGHYIDFELPRQAKDHQLCLADFVHSDRKKNDQVAFFVVSVGVGVRELAESLKNQGSYLRSHIVQALALESAEAFAEFLHAQIRRMWGIGDPPETTMMDRFQARYSGKRYSFGYPACPNLSDQKQLFELLRPEEVGVQLTDGDMMEPEASVSALVFHHPKAVYFSVGSGGENDG